MHRIARSAVLVAAIVPTSFAQTWTIPAPGLPEIELQRDEHGHAALARSGGLESSTGEPDEREDLTASGWIPLGPFGGDVDDVAASPTVPSVVLAGIAPSGSSGGTLYRSTDAAATWSAVAQLANVSVHDVEFAANGDAFIGTIDGIWKSTDGGASWTQLSLGIGLNDQVFEVALDPSNASTLWVGVADALGGQSQNVLMSANGGTSWTNRTPPLASPQSCRSIAIDPSNSSKVYAAFGGAFGGGAVWVSTNGGTSWINRSAGLPGNPMNSIVHDGARVLLGGGQLFGSQFVGLYSSANDGASWTQVHDGTWPNLVINDIAVDAASASTIYLASAGSGIYRSADGGTSWSFGIGGTGALSVNAVTPPRSGGTPVYSGSASVGVWKSANGLDFAQSSVGIGSLNLESIAANPLDGDEHAVAFAGLNNGGVYTSLDGGVTWTLEALPGTRYNTVAFAADGTLYAISDGPTTIAAEGIWRRDGSSWTSLGPDQGTLFESELYGLAFDPLDCTRLVASGGDFGVAGFEPTVWVFEPGSGLWSKTYEGTVSSESVRSVAFLVDGGDQNLVACFVDFSATQSGGALRSIDAGVSWTQASTGLAGNVQCYSLVPSHRDPSTVYLGDDHFPSGTVYRSTDGGQSWVNRGSAVNAHALLLDPLRTERLFIASSLGARVQISEDGGASVAPFDTGLAGAGAVRNLALVPGACNRLLLSTSNGAYAEPEGGCRLEASVATISLSAGGTLGLDLDAGPAEAGRRYLALGGYTGTSPGTQILSILLPLNFDDFTITTIALANTSMFVNTFGTLDSEGGASASIVLPALSDPLLAGLVVNFAYGTFTFGPLWTFLASNAVEVVLVP